MVLRFLALITSLCQFYGVPVAPSKVIRPILTELSSRCTAPPGRRRARHHSSLGMAGSGQQTHCRHLQSPSAHLQKLERCLQPVVDLQATKSKAKGKQKY